MSPSTNIDANKKNIEEFEKTLSRLSQPGEQEKLMAASKKIPGLTDGELDLLNSLLDKFIFDYQLRVLILERIVLFLVIMFLYLR